MRVLVTGGIRSGKSARAEALARAFPATSPSATGDGGGVEVAYVACGPTHDDADWQARVRAHRARRPAAWRTLETTDLVGAVGGLAGPALVDCLGTWLTARLDTLDAWEGERARWEAALRAEVDAVVDALRGCPHDIVLVTNEVGLSLVPERRSGRIFADWLGWTNQAVAEVCDRVELVVAGQVLTVKG